MAARLDDLEQFLEPPDEGDGALDSLSTKYGVPADLVRRVMRQESGGRQFDRGGRVLRSSKGALGRMQVLPDTAKQYGLDPNDPDQNLEAGVRYLADSYKRWKGDEALTLAGYHSGIEDAQKALANPRGNPKTHNYVRSILGTAGYRQALASSLRPQRQPAGTDDPLEAFLEPQEQPERPGSVRTGQAQPPLPAASVASPDSPKTDTGDFAAPFREALTRQGADQHSEAWQQTQADMATGATAAGLPQAASSRERLIDAINRTEQAGFRTPHFIGTPDEPTGDRGVTRDIENLVTSLKAREAATPRGPARDAIARERAYWEREAAEGMTAEEWRQQTGESDPLYSHEQTIIDRETGRPYVPGTLPGVPTRELEISPEAIGSVSATARLQMPKVELGRPTQQRGRRISTERGLRTGAGATVPVEMIEEARRRGDSDAEILRAIQDTIARQVGLSSSEVEILEQRFGAHPLANIVESGTDQASGIDSIIRQGRSNNGIAEFNILPETVKALRQQTVEAASLLAPAEVQAQGAPQRPLYEGFIPGLDQFRWLAEQAGRGYNVLQPSLYAAGVQLPAATVAPEQIGDELIRQSGAAATGAEQAMLSGLGAPLKGIAALRDAFASIAKPKGGKAQKAAGSDDLRALGSIFENIDIGPEGIKVRDPNDPSYRKVFAQETGETIGGKLGQATGSSMTMMLQGAAIARALEIGGAGAGLMARSGTFGAAATGALQNAGSTYDEATQKGASPEKAAQASVFGALLGLSEGAGLGGTFDRVAARKFAGKIAKAWASEALEEAGQEGFQGFMQNVLAHYSYDPKREVLTPEALKKNLIAAGVAGVTGGLMGGGAHVAGAAVDLVQERADRRTIKNAEEALNQGETVTPDEWADYQDAVFRQLVRQEQVGTKGAGREEARIQEPRQKQGEAPAPAAVPEAAQTAAGILTETQPKGEPTDATQTRIEQEGDEAELRGVRRGENLPAYEGEVREGAGRQAEGGGRVEQGRQEPEEVATVPPEGTTVPPEAPIVPREGEIVSETPARVTGPEGAVARARQQERRAVTEAQTDKLTGLQSQSQWESAQSRIDADPELHVATLDFNDLKKTNDQFGHAAGDAYLRQAGQIAVEEAKKAGLTLRLQFRTGGDEFRLVGPKDAVEQAARETKRRVAEEIDLPDGGKGSVAVGVAPTAKRSDALMYADKLGMKKAAAKKGKPKKPAPAPVAGKPPSVEAAKPATPNLTDKVKEIRARQKAQQARLDEQLRMKLIDRQEHQKRSKGLAMRTSAEVREVTGELTGREREKKRQREAGNYIGKAVEVEGRAATVVSNPFGKVKVKFEDGTTKTVAAEAVKERGVVEPEVAAIQTPPPTTAKQPIIYERAAGRAFDRRNRYTSANYYDVTLGQGPNAPAVRIIRNSEKVKDFSVKRLTRERREPFDTPPIISEVSEQSARAAAENFLRKQAGAEPSIHEASTAEAERIEALTQKERADKTGMTKSQRNYLADKLEEVHASGDVPATIRVPADGEFTVRGTQAAEILYKRVTGETLEPEKAAPLMVETGAPTGAAPAKPSKKATTKRTSPAPKPAQPTAAPAVEPVKEAVKKPATKARLQIRPTQYRGESGFSVQGKDTAGRDIKIFVRQRETADAVKTAISEGRQDDVSSLIRGEQPAAPTTQKPPKQPVAGIAPSTETAKPAKPRQRQLANTVNQAHRARRGKQAEDIAPPRTEITWTPTERSGTLMFNQAATDWLVAVTGTHPRTRGLTFDRTRALNMAAKAERLIAETTEPASRRALTEVAAALRNAAEQREEFHLETPLAGPATKLHEQTHVADIAIQRFFGYAPRLEAYQALPHLTEGQDLLKRKGYTYVDDPRLAAQELFAHVAGGQWREIKLSTRKAFEFFDAYLKMIAQEYRPDALRAYEHLAGNFGRVRDATIERERARAAETAAARTGPTGRRGVPEGRTQGGAQGRAAKLEEKAPTPADIARQTETPEFKRWFRDSKVVDENGNPLVVYHGTIEEFDEFQAGEFGFHFGDETAANMQGTPMPVFLSAQKPLRLRDLGTWTPDRVLEAARQKGVFTEEEFLRLLQTTRPSKSLQRQLDNDDDFAAQRRAHYEWSRPIREALEAKGYDSIVYRNEAEGYADAWLMFRPTQIKSAIGNRGTFDPTSGNILADIAAADPFYSHLTRTLERQQQERFTPEQLEGVLRSAGVKPDELTWTGFDDFLAEKKQRGERVTRADALEFARQNAVEVREAVRGGAAGLTPDEDARYYNLVRREELTPAEEAEVRALQEKQEGPPATKFERYQLPGGQNYRELLLTLPAKEQLPPGFEVFEQPSGGWAVRFPDGRELGTWMSRQAAIDSQKRQPGSPIFQSSHFDEPNVLAHVRFNERTDADGNRVLFIEELQSDWHQKGRREGYAKDTKGWTAQSLVEPDAGFTHWQINDADGNYVTKIVGGTKESAIQKAAEGIPAAPFAKTWPELALKRMVRWAAENGFDRVAWTTGEQQAERYDLSKHVSRVEYNEKTGRLFAPSRTDDTAIKQDGVTPEKLVDYIGKDAADRMMAQEPDARGQRVLEGEDLKVGGEGMKGFYDRILPSVAAKLGKKFGAKVGKSDIPIQRDSERSEKEQPRGALRIAVNRAYNDRFTADVSGEGYFRSVRDEGGDIAFFDTTTEARKAAKDLIARLQQATPVHSLDITPAMRESALSEGFQMFDLADLPPDIQQGLRDLAASFVEDGLTDPTEIARQMEQLLDPELVEEYGGLLPQIARQAIAPESAEPPAPEPIVEPVATTLHTQRFGDVTVDQDQHGIQGDHLRVTDQQGNKHVIQNPRTAGNREAAFKRGEAQPADRPGLVAESSRVRKRSTPGTLREYGLDVEEQYYQVKPNAVAVKYARELIARHGAEAAKEIWLSNNEISAESTATGIGLIAEFLRRADEAQEIGEVDAAAAFRERAGQVSDDLAARQTEAGRSNSAVNTVASFAPERLVMVGQRQLTRKGEGERLTAQQIKELSEMGRRVSQLESEVLRLEGKLADVQEARQRGGKPPQNWRARLGSMEAEIRARMRTKPGREFADIADQTETEAFKRWFGESKVIDEEGKPLVVYHGTSAKDFAAFKRRLGDVGIHFGTAGQANDRIAYRNRTDSPIIEGERLIPVFLRLQNPLRLTDIGAWNADNLQYELRKIFGNETINRIMGYGRTANAQLAELRDFLERKGHDGIVYRNTGETAGGAEFGARQTAAFKALMESQRRRSRPLNAFDAEDRATPEYQAYQQAEEAYRAFRETNAEDSYIAFRPEQIKSAIGNAGAFSPKTGNILADLDTPDDLVVLGAARLARPGISLVEWSRGMIEDFGEQVRPQLNSIRYQSAALIRDMRRQDREASEPGRERSLLAQTYDEINDLAAQIRQDAREAERAEQRETREAGRAEVKAARQQEAAEREAIATEARERLREARQEARRLEKAEAKRIREERKEQKRATVLNRQWDAPIKADALANPDDQVAVGAAILAAEPIRVFDWQRQMRQRFGENFTDPAGVFQQAAERVDEARGAAARRRLTGQAPDAFSEAQIEELENRRKAAMREAQQARQQVARYLEDLQGGWGWRAWRTVVDIAGIPRSAMTSFDLSNPGRQALPISLAHPMLAKEAWSMQWAALKSASETEHLIEWLATHPRRASAERNGLAIPQLTGEREESVPSRIAGKFPGIKQSQRAYDAFSGGIRMLAYDYLAAQNEQAHHFNEDSNPRFYRDLAKLVNIMSGRGQIPKSMEGLAPALNNVFFSMRLWSSRAELAFPIRAAFAEPNVRKIWFRDLFKVYGATTSLLMFASALGALGFSVNWDPDDQDFLYIRHGNTRWDVSGGIRGPLKFVARLALAFGRKMRGEEGQGRQVGDIFLQEGRTKLAPVPGAIISAYTGKKPTGEETTALGELGGLFTPMIGRDAYEGWKDAGGTDLMKWAKGEEKNFQTGFKGAAKAGLPAFFGISTQTYRDSIPSDVRKAFRQAGKTFGRPPKREGESPEDYKKRLEAQAAEVTTDIRTLVRSEPYLRADKQTRRAMISAVVKEARKEANAGEPGDEEEHLETVEFAEARAAVRNRQDFQQLNRTAQAIAIRSITKGAPDVEIELEIERARIRDGMLTRLKAGERYREMSEEERKQVTEALGKLLRQYGIPEGVEKAGEAARIKTASRLLELLRKADQQDFFNKQAEKLGSRKAAA